MADKSSRTEAPTAKRRREARRSGMVARSSALGGWAGMLAASLAVPALGPGLLAAWQQLFVATTAVMAHPSPGAAVRLLGGGLTSAFTATVPVLAIATGVALITGVGQVGLRLSPKSLWNPGHLSPAAGIKRLVSPQGAWTVGRSIVELAVLGGIGYLAVHSLLTGLLVAGPFPLASTVRAAGAAVAGAVRDLAAAGLAISVADWAMQRRRLNQQLRMTKQEVKEEARQSEGSPELRRAVRVRQRKLSRSRMAAEVANAAAVVTNPTHLAIALAYERGVDAAPRVVAKGMGSLALAIRREARRHGVPVIEDKPLAWTIHAACEEGAPVPPHLYQAVAQVLAFVYSLSPTARSLVDTHHLAGART